MELTTKDDSDEIFDESIPLNATENNANIIDEKKRKWILGVIFIVLVAIIWTFASVLVQYIFDDLSFKGPFFLTYVATSLFSVNLPIRYMCERFNFVEKISMDRGDDATSKATVKQTIKISAIISPLWFIANFSYNLSLGYTSVTSSTVISTTSVLFTFILSLWILHEKFSWVKLAGVVLCIVGNLVTIFKDSPDSAKNTLYGDVLALFSAFMYGVYTTYIRKYIPDDDYVSIPLFFGWLGVINAVVLFPVVVLCYFTNTEPLQNLTWEIFGLLVVKGLFDNVLSDYLWARSVVLTSPTVATVGLSLTIPFAIASDRIIHHVTPHVLTYIASVLVIMGFLMINIGSAMFLWRNRLKQLCSR